MDRIKEMGFEIYEENGDIGNGKENGEYFCIFFDRLLIRNSRMGGDLKKRNGRVHFGN